MNAIKILKVIKKYADNYRNEAQESLERNNHMNEIEDEEIVLQRYIDAVLVDFINYIGMEHGVDYALYTKDLKERTK